MATLGTEYLNRPLYIPDSTLSVITMAIKPCSKPKSNKKMSDHTS